MNLHQFREPRTTPYQTRFINRLAEVADNAIVQCAVAASNAAMHIRSPQGVKGCPPHPAFAASNRCPQYPRLQA